MGLSLRDLMRREKESRKRKPSEDEDENKTKLQKISQQDEISGVKEPLSTDSTDNNKKSNDFTTNESNNLKFDQQTSESTGVSLEPEDKKDKNVSENFSVPSPLNKLKQSTKLNENYSQNQEFKRTVSDNSDLEVLEETYELLEDDESPTTDFTGKDLNNKSKTRSNLLNESGILSEMGTRIGMGGVGEDVNSKEYQFQYQLDRENLESKSDGNAIFDENRLVYEQLNTAYCSNLDYEHENILKEVGVNQNLNSISGTGIGGVYEDLNLNEYQYQFDNDDDDLESKLNENNNVITSSNFGTSTLSVSSTDNIPIGFFDDQNVDAKARGKLTAKEAQNKIKEISKKRSSYLKEAKYIQQKFMEEHREQTKMENELLDHNETYKELQNKLNKIKDDLNVNTNDLKLDPEKDNKIEEILKQYSDLDYDDLSWMSRSIV